MDSPERGALMLVRFIAAALIGWAALNEVLYYVVQNHNHLPLGIFPCVVKAFPFVAGVVILVKSKSLAEWLSDKLDL
jgi:hypothetical protein